VVEQYPDTITVKTYSDSTMVNGEPVQGTESTQTLKGRWQTNTSGQFTRGTDGTQVVYSGIVFLPLLSSAIVLGSKITVSGMRNGVPFEVSGEAQNVSMGFYNTRIWL
jgi:hypothetical protein